jgi:hypothetical protein
MNNTIIVDIESCFFVHKAFVLRYVLHLKEVIAITFQLVTRKYILKSATHSHPRYSILRPHILIDIKEYMRYSLC